MSTRTSDVICTLKVHSSKGFSISEFCILISIYSLSYSLTTCLRKNFGMDENILLMSSESLQSWCNCKLRCLNYFINIFISRGLLTECGKQTHWKPSHDALLIYMNDNICECYQPKLLLWQTLVYNPIHSIIQVLF